MYNGTSVYNNNNNNNNAFVMRHISTQKSVLRGALHSVYDSILRYIVKGTCICCRFGFFCRQNQFSLLDQWQKQGHNTSSLLYILYECVIVIFKYILTENQIFIP